MDGPLANLELGFLHVWQARFPKEFFIPIEKRKKSHLTQEYPNNLRGKIESILNTRGFFLNLPPVESGIEAVKEMISDNRNKILICSSGIYANKNSIGEKRFWLEKYLGQDVARYAVFTKDKTVIRGDYLIDDNPSVEIGTYTPEWKYIIFDQPFNKNSKHKLRIKSDWSNWRKVLN